MRRETVLPNDFVSNPNAIEEVFCKPFAELEQRPMTMEQTEILIRLSLGGDAVKTGYNAIPFDERPFGCRIIEKRLQTFTYTIDDPAVMLMIDIMSQSKPAVIVMYLTYLQYWCHEHNVRDINLELFTMEIFPMGFPSDDDLHELWEDQKVDNRGAESDNLLDYPEALQSIQFPTGH